MPTGWENFYHRKPELGCSVDEDVWCVQSRHQNEPCVITAHTISTHTDSARAQEGEEKLNKITPISSTAMKIVSEEEHRPTMARALGAGINALQYTWKAV